VEEKVDPTASQESCLTEELALKLARLGVQLEKSFGSPRDIEFAIKQVGDQSYK
jgi:phosphoenolpyruvate synthase/pyruvate phosphate dikinase